MLGKLMESINTLENPSPVVHDYLYIQINKQFGGGYFYCAKKKGKGKHYHDGMHL